MARRGRPAGESPIRRRAAADPDPEPARRARRLRWQAVVQRPRPGRTASHAVLAASDTAGQVSGRAPWISVPASRRPSSSWSSWCWPRSATGSSCPRSPTRTGPPRRPPRPRRRRPVGPRVGPGVPGTPGSHADSGDGFTRRDRDREHLLLAAVHPAGPGRCRRGDGEVRRRLQHLLLHRERFRLRRHDERPDHRAAGHHAAGPVLDSGGGQGQDQPRNRCPPGPR